MKNTLYLHVGSWKAGSTTLQSFMALNYRAFAKAGFYIPTNTENHTFLAHKFHQERTSHKAAQGRDLVKLERQAEREIEELLRASRTQSVVCSSEFLFGMSEASIRSLKTFFEPYFSSIKVVVYIRDPVKHAVSAVNEQVKQGHHTLEQAYNSAYLVNPNTFKNLNNWRRVFGESAVYTNLLDKDYLYNSDLLLDFSKAIGLSALENFNFSIKKENETLSADAIYLASLIQRKDLSRTENNRVVRILKSIEGAPFEADQSFVDKVSGNTKREFERYLGALSKS